MNKYEKKISVLDSGFVAYIDHMGDDAAIPQAARVSYQKGTKSVSSDENLIRFLMRHEHYSPFAMCQIKLHVRLPIFVHNQWIRHDRFAWNMMSGRYSEMPQEKWTPSLEDLRGQSTTNKQVGTGSVGEDAEWCRQEIEDTYSRIQDSYEQLLVSGLCREQARTVLPMGQYTEGFVTANLGDWMLFLKQRLDSHAQKEIQVYAEAVYEILHDLFPVSMQAFMDYQMNGKRFSAQEMALIKELLIGRLTREPAPIYVLGIAQPRFGYTLEESQEWFQKILPNKRERDEFLEKIKS